MADSKDQLLAEKEATNIVDLASKDEGLDQEEAKDINKSHDNQSLVKETSFVKEELLMKKKYGALIPKKPPIISNDNERAFFDSADWALAKKSKGPLEALRPKLQPTPHQQARNRSAYAQPISKDEEDTDSCVSDYANPVKDQTTTKDDEDVESETVNTVSSSDQQNHQDEFHKLTTNNI